MAQSRILDILFLVFILAVFFPSGECIRCWDCNSAYDPRCGDPFDNHSIALVDCSQMSYTHLAVKEASLCRKTTQKVNGVLRIVRGCGWLNSTHEDGGLSCFQRSGSQDVYLTHCTCFTDGCNAGHWFKPNSVVLFALPIFILITKRFL